MLGLDFFNRKEKFLLLEIAPRRTSGLLLSVDKDKKISAEKFWDNFSFKVFKGDPLKSLRKRQIILSLHPAFINTLFCGLTVERDKDLIGKEITLPEIENLFSRSLGKLFNEYRKDAASRMGLPEIDTILVGVKTNNFKVDGHLVLNPIGFKGKTVEAGLELTFTTRELFDDLKDFFKAQDGFFLTGIPRAAIFTISKLEPPPLGFFMLHPESSFYFVLDRSAGTKTVREGKISWSSDSLFDAISGNLGVSPDVTLSIYFRHLDGKTSAVFKRSIENLLKPVKQALFSEIKDLNIGGNAYLYSAAPLPINFPFRACGATLKDLPLDEALQRFGFSLDRSKPLLSNGEMFMKLAPFFEFYFGKNDSEINKRLKRRLHWLT